jgi:competence protein ComEC
VEELGKYRMEPFLKSQGVASLDYVFVTHGDTDHYSGIEEMIKRQDLGVEIRRLVFPSNWKKDDALVELAQTAKKAGVSILMIESGKCITEGNLQIECIQPSTSDYHLNGNAGSLVLSVTFGEFSMLCTGDVEAKGEDALTKRLTDREFTVLKVAHHGSKHSSSEAFLRTAQPEIAFISAGEDNSYGHPHQEILKRLKGIGCKIFETVRNGAITLQTDGNRLTIDCFLY